MSLLSILLAVAMVLSMLSPLNILASGDDSSEYSIRAGLLRAIGIDIDESAISVKRSEFVKYIADAFNLSDISFSGYLPYTDVSEKDNFYQAVGVLYDLGVLSANDVFNPDANITSAEAAKIIVSALGYDYIAQAKGGYPSGYLSVANGMDISVASEDTINGKVMTDIIYETLLATPNYASVANKLPHADGKNGFYVYHRITEIEGVVTSNNITSIYSYVDITDGDNITIDGKTYSFDTDISDGVRTIDGCLGANVKAYVYDYGGKDEKIIFFDSSDSDFVVFASVDADKNGFDISVMYENTGKTYKLSSGYSVILNGKLSDDFTDSDFKKTDGNILLIDNNGDRRYDVISIENPEYIIAESFNSQSGFISDKNKHAYGKNNIKEIDLDKEDTIYEYFMYIDGKMIPCTIEDLESFKSFSLIMSNDEKYIGLTGFSNVISGEVTETSDSEIIIENKPYKETSYSINHNVYIPFNSYLSAYLTPEGKLIYIESDENSLSYGFLMKIGHTGGLGGYCAALLSGSGTKQVVDFGAKITLDGVKISADFDNTSSTAYTKLFDKPQLIKYSINKDGKISTIDTVEETTDYASLNSYHIANDPKNSLMKYTDVTKVYKETASYTTCFAPYLVPRTVKIFTVPKILSTADASTYQFNMEDFNVIGVEEFPEGVTTIDVFDITRNRDAGAIVLFTDDEANSLPALSSRSTNAVVDRIVDSVNEDGELVKKLTYITVKDGESEASYTTGLFTPTLQSEYNRRGYDIKPGDYVYIRRSGEEISNIMPMVFYDSWSVNSESGVDVKCSDYLSLDFMVKGKLVDFSDSVISVLVDDDDPNDGYDNKQIIAYPTMGTQYLVRFNPDMNCFEKIGVDDLKTIYNSSMESADRIIIRSGYMELFGIAIYPADN